MFPPVPRPVPRCCPRLDTSHTHASSPIQDWVVVKAKDQDEKEQRSVPLLQVFQSHLCLRKASNEERYGFEVAAEVTGTWSKRPRESSEKKRTGKVQGNRGQQVKQAHGTRDVKEP